MSFDPGIASMNFDPGYTIVHRLLLRFWKHEILSQVCNVNMSFDQV
jgi:hypothetical protein